MYFAIKSTPKVSVSNFWGAVHMPRPTVFFGVYLINEMLFTRLTKLFAKCLIGKINRFI
ncbi:hypothetical protein [Moraxella lacunata]|uniref:hypothetical protein n=1 Tax=Moraxella lacunata TaxID=477 RepID=UPI003EE16B6E